MRSKPNYAGKRPLGTWLVPLALVAIAGSCAPCDLDAVGRTEEGKNAMLRIVLGEGGGFTGTWEGYTIAGGGVVSAWRGQGARENEHEIGRLHADTMCALWDAAKVLTGVPEVDSGGSLVRFLSVTVHDTTRKFSWRPQIGSSSSRLPFQEFYDRCSAAIYHTLTLTKTSTAPSGK